MYHILSRQVVGRKYSHWNVILREFDLEFSKSKSKKSLVFTELICSLRRTDKESESIDHIPDETLFLISMSDPWYANVLKYLQTQRI